MSFPVKSFGLLVLLAVVIYGLSSILANQLMLPHILGFLVGFCALSIFIHWLTLRISKTAGDQFPNFYMGVIGIKMFSFLLVAFGYFALVGKEGRGEIFIALVCYLAFTGLEVLSTVKLLKKKAS